MSVLAFAEDGNSNFDQNSQETQPCFIEGQSMAVYPGNYCCEGLNAINPQTTAEPLVGASICSKCGNEICEHWENQYNCAQDCTQTYQCASDSDCKELVCPTGGSAHETCQNGTCISPSQDSCNEIIVNEEVKCVFENATAQQTCNSENYSCTAYPVATTCGSTNGLVATTCIDGEIKSQTISCVAQVSGENGDKLTWKSSCGGYAYTLLDGINEYAKFNCGNIQPIEVTEQVKCLFNSTEKQKCYSFFGEQLFSCTTGENGNYQSCVADVKAQSGTKLVWKSSCGGYAYTIADGTSEYAKFDCPTEVNPSEPEPIPVCACTKEYAPVCGAIKICTTACAAKNITSNEVSTCSNSCFEDKKTFSNSCEAKCAGAISYSEGACEQTCPIYATPICPNGKIEVTYDERGCKKPRCVAEEAEHFSGVYFKCSNGMEFKEAGACMPYASWKEKARNTCAQYSQKCGDINSSTSTTSGGQSSSTNPISGNFILDVVNAVTNAVVPQPTPIVIEPIQKPQPIIIDPIEQPTPVDIKCIGGEVYVTAFETFGSCTPGNETCKYYVNQNGCKVKECIDGEKEIACPTTPIPITNTYRKAYWQCASGKEFFQGGESSCKTDVLWKQYATEACANECSQLDTVCAVDSNVCQASTTTCGVNAFNVSDPCYDGKPIFCSTQTEEEISAAKEKCYKNNSNAELKVEFNSNGCRTYTCATETQVCNYITALPAEKKISCEERGGQLITKTDDAGCLTYVDCVGEQITDSNAEINPTLIKDKIQLLDLAIKIETAKIDLEKTAAKLREIANYYESTGQMADANRFNKAANIIEAAANKLDEIKQEIKDNVDNFGEDRAKNIREIIRNIKEDLLKEALLEMLG